MKSGIEVVIMCRERPSETNRAIDALAKVDFGTKTKIVVSDNPSTPSKFLTNIPREVSHIKRNPSGSWNWHFNKIVSELEYEWCLITHDDDEILPILGDIFCANRTNSGVSVITGLSQIVHHESGLIYDQNYEKRLESAGLKEPAGQVRRDLSHYLFDQGTLFPASAMIIRSSLLQSLPPLDERFELTADFGLSVLIAHESGVIFEGRQPVMKYHLHQNNSVFSDVAMGGIKADFTITRILLLDKYPELFNESRLTLILKSVIQSKILVSAFGLTQRRKTLIQTIKSSDLLKKNKLKYSLMTLPIRLGPLAPIVRYLMRKRLGN